MLPRFRSQVSQCEICGRQSGTGTGFSPNTSHFPDQHHSIDSPYTSSSTYCSYQKKKTDAPSENKKKAMLFGNRRALDRKLLSFFNYKQGCIILYFSIQIYHQPDATIFQFIISTFIHSSTCFGRCPAHHQDLSDCSSSLWFCLGIVVIVVLCSWSGRPAITTIRR